MEEDTPNYMYIIFSGKVKVIQLSTDGREKVLTYHKKGEFFGEMALIDGKTSTATIIAIEDTESEIEILDSKNIRIIPSFLEKTTFL